MAECDLSREEIQEFWKLGDQLLHLDEDDPTRQMVEASYEPLKAKVLSEMGELFAESAKEAEMDMMKVVDQFRTLFCVFLALKQMVPQLQADPTVLALAKNCDNALSWLDEHKDSLKNLKL